jgi:D-psicose/D-tagatose/L-ribulose 3-epimerase
MKFGVHSFIWTADFGPPDLALLPKLKAAGFDGVELPIFHPATYPAAEIRRGFASQGLECTFSAVMVEGMNTISEDGAVRARTRTYLADCIKAVAETGSKLLVGPLYAPVGYLPGRRRTADEWQWVIEAFQALGPVAAQHGVTLALEPLNRFETYFLNLAADAVKLVEAVGHPNVGVLLDTFHLNIEEKDIAGAYRLAGKHLKHVHTCENDRGAPGSGHVEWTRVFEALREIGYDGWLTIESFGFALGGISAAASIWRDIERTPDDIAFEGVKFLKRNMGCPPLLSTSA